jgi:DNA polymerase (family 10)
MRGPNRCRVALAAGPSADLRVLPEKHWGALLHHFTGNKYHNIRLRDMALARGARMSEYGYAVGDELVTCATEEEVYAYLGLQ